MIHSMYKICLRTKVSVKILWTYVLNLWIRATITIAWKIPIRCPCFHNMGSHQEADSMDSHRFSSKWDNIYNNNSSSLPAVNTNSRDQWLNHKGSRCTSNSRTTIQLNLNNKLIMDSLIQANKSDVILWQKNKGEKIKFKQIKKIIH